MVSLFTKFFNINSEYLYFVQLLSNIYVAQSISVCSITTSHRSNYQHPIYVLCSHAIIYKPFERIQFSLLYCPVSLKQISLRAYDTANLDLDLSFDP